LQDKIKVINVGCSNKEGKSTLYFMPHNEGLSSLEKTEGAQEETITLKKLDNIIKNLEINSSSINVVKIDVEGFELNVLKGSQNILKRGSPFLIIEITDKKKERPIIEFLRGFGFKNKEILDGRNFIFVKSKTKLV